MSKLPLVSIILPSYNYAHFIKRCVDSIIAQTYTEWELIITDDNSQDNSLEVLKIYESHPQIQIHSNKRNLGLYNNIVQGTSYVQGEFVKILMADDWLHPDYLLRTMESFNKYPSIGLCSVRAKLVDTEAKTLEIRREPSRNQVYYNRNEMMGYTMRHINPIGNPSRVIYRKSAYEQVGGFDLGIEYCTEYELWLRMLEDWDCAIIPEVLSYESMHPTNATKVYAANARHITTAEKMFTKLFPSHPFFKDNFLRQQRVWLFGLSDYWNTSIRHMFMGNHTEINELIHLLKRNSYSFLWIPLLIWYTGQYLLRKLFSKMGSLVGKGRHIGNEKWAE